MPFATTGFLKIGSTVIECDSINYVPNNTTEAIATAGLVSPLDVIGTGGTPMFTCTTKDVIRALTLSLLINDIAGNATTAYLQNFASGGTLAAKCSSYAMAKGVIVIDSISAPLGSVATATISVYPASSDGFVSPIVFVEENADLPTYTKQTTWLTVGTASINSAAVTKSTGIEIAFNHQIVQEKSQGSYFPIDCYSRGYAPTMTIGTFDAKGANTIVTEKGKTLGTGGAVAILYSTDATGVISATTGKTFTITKGFATLGDRSHSQGSTMEAQITVAASYDATNAAIIVA